MATGYAAELVGVADGSIIPAKLLDGRVQGGRVRAYIATLDMAQATTKRANGDTNHLFGIPAGEKPIALGLCASATMGANATVAVGTAAAAGKYRAAATHTVTTLVWSALSSFLDDAPLAAAEDVILTVGHADGLPGAGVLTVIILTSGR